jgi:hypothetical protein
VATAPLVVVKNEHAVKLKNAHGRMLSVHVVT